METITNKKQENYRQQKLAIGMSESEIQYRLEMGILLGKAEDIGCPGNIELAEYVFGLEKTIETMQSTIKKLSEYIKDVDYKIEYHVDNKRKFTTDSQWIVNEAKSLQDLCNILSGVSSEQERQINYSNLPNFGGTAPQGIKDVYSWDKQYVLLNDGNGFYLECR